MRGHLRKNEEPPDWITTLQIAKEFNVPPWRVEDEMSQEWFERWMDYRIAQQKEAERK